MAKIKYYYDTKTLSYKPIDSTGVDKFKNFIIYFTSSAILAFFIILIFFQYFDSPKEKRLKNEINNLTTQYEFINNNLKQIELVLDDIQKRDAWMLRAENSNLDEIWICQITNISQNNWSSVSDSGHFNSLEWRRPKMLGATILNNE